MKKISTFSVAALLAFSNASHSAVNVAPFAHCGHFIAEAVGFILHGPSPERSHLSTIKSFYKSMTPDVFRLRPPLKADPVSWELSAERMEELLDYAKKMDLTAWATIGFYITLDPHRSEETLADLEWLLMAGHSREWVPGEEANLQRTPLHELRLNQIESFAILCNFPGQSAQSLVHTAVHWLKRYRWEYDDYRIPIIKMLWEKVATLEPLSAERGLLSGALYQYQRSNSGL